MAVPALLTSFKDRQIDALDITIGAENLVEMFLGDILSEPVDYNSPRTDRADRSRARPWRTTDGFSTAKCESKRAMRTVTATDQSNMTESVICNKEKLRKADTVDLNASN
jgi:hypothetical protein